MTEPNTRLEVFSNPAPERDYTIRMSIPEFTCLCPKTGQPDFATLELEYVPNERCVELKSLKLYIWSYRSRGAFHEAVTNEILQDLVAATSPRFMRISAKFNVRGGIYTTVVVEHRAAEIDGGGGVKAQFAVELKQGRPPYGVDMKIVDPEGKELPRDGKASGDLYVRGPWIISGYFKGESSPLVYGWFPTGDVATIDPDGYMQITDRSKDVIKSGGEWIGSIDLENIAMAHPAVAMAAVIAAKHPKWDERPLLVVVKKPGQDVTRDALLKFYEGKIAKWWTPDDVVFVEGLPLGATGKVQKNKLREQFREHRLPTV